MDICVVKIWKVTTACFLIAFRQKKEIPRVHYVCSLFIFIYDRRRYKEVSWRVGVCHLQVDHPTLYWLYQILSFNEQQQKQQKIIKLSASEQDKIKCIPLCSHPLKVSIVKCRHKWFTCGFLTTCQCVCPTTGPLERLHTQQSFKWCRRNPQQQASSQSCMLTKLTEPTSFSSLLLFLFVTSRANMAVHISSGEI